MKVDMSHRINHAKDKPIDRQDLLDGIDDAARQADAIIGLMQSWHIADAEGGVDQINPEILFYTLESVSRSIADMRALGQALRSDLRGW